MKLLFSRKPSRKRSSRSWTAMARIGLLIVKERVKIGGRLIESSKVNPLYVTEMQPNVTVLAKLAQHGPERGNESAKPYYRAVLDATRFEHYSDAALEQIRILDFHDERF